MKNDSCKSKEATMLSEDNWKCDVCGFTGNTNQMSRHLNGKFLVIKQEAVSNDK